MCPLKTSLLALSLKASLASTMFVTFASRCTPSRRRNWTQQSESRHLIGAASRERIVTTDKTVQRTGASRFAQRQIQRHRQLAPVADHCVRRINPIQLCLDY